MSIYLYLLVSLAAIFERVIKHMTTQAVNKIPVRFISVSLIPIYITTCQALISSLTTGLSWKKL